MICLKMKILRNGTNKSVRDFTCKSRSYRGKEKKKTRPCLVISPNEMNKNLKTIMVAPMITTSKPYSTRVEVLHNDMQGWIVLDQIRTIDRTRIVKILGTLSEKEAKKSKAYY
jgi:mRNA interferase MazF